MKDKNLLSQAIQQYIESLVTCDEFETKLKKSRIKLDDDRKKLESLLLKTFVPEKEFLPELIYNWVDGWNNFEIDGVVYTFRYHADDHTISNFDTLRIIKIDEPKSSEPKIRVFVGPPMSGKSRRAKELVEGKKFMWIDGRSKYIIDSPHGFQHLELDTEYIIVDDIPTPKQLVNLLHIFFSQFLVVNPQGKKSFQVPTPKVILTTSFDNEFKPKPYMKHRIEITDFGKKEVADAGDSTN